MGTIKSDTHSNINYHLLSQLDIHLFYRHKKNKITLKFMLSPIVGTTVVKIKDFG